MPTLDSRIDDLYKLSPDEFVPARTALAKSLTGTDAKTVKTLIKPTIVPWAVNQVYWHARDVYTRMMKAGEKLREAQLTALKGRASDVRGATTAHRQAVSEAAKAASRLATDAGAKPDPDQLARMFEAVSLQKTLPEPHGRFTKPLQPQGFEALAGVAIKAAPASPRTVAQHEEEESPRSRLPVVTAAQARAERRREEERAAEAKRLATALKAAEKELSNAHAAEAKARTAWDDAKKALDEAERVVAGLRAQTST